MFVCVCVCVFFGFSGRFGNGTNVEKRREVEMAEEKDTEELICTHTPIDILLGCGSVTERKCCLSTVKASSSCFDGFVRFLFLFFVNG